jgi:hypothetical protein
MKKLIASAGVFVAGSAAIQAQNTAFLPPGQAGKFWTVSAALRGFYDDNYLTAPSGGYTGVPNSGPRDSFGFEFNPSLKLNLPRDQTFFQAGYNYSMKYYLDRDDDPIDNTHEITALVDHRFSERYRLTLDESFVYSQEPEIIEAGGPIASPLRGDSTGARNRASLTFSALITRLIGARVSYQNTWYDYEQDGDFSRSALLDRMEHNFDLAGQWLMDESQIVSLGYILNVANYTSDDLISEGALPFPFIFDDIPGSARSSVGHVGYVGFEKKLAPRFSFEGKAGLQYTTYEEAGSDSTLSPYVDLSASYEYQPGSRFTLGAQHVRSATDQVGQGTDVTVDAESTVGYLSISHRLTPKITGNLTGQFQHSVLSGGQMDGDVDNLYLVGLGFDYRMNNNWSAELSYYWDRLASDTPDRSFSRNRIYLGARATF